MNSQSHNIGKLIEKILDDGVLHTYHLGDLNQDGFIDKDDLEIMELMVKHPNEAKKLIDQMSPAALASCDVNEDNAIDIHDLLELYRSVLIETEKLSLTDELTGLNNRRALKDKLKIRLYAAQRYKHPLTCVAIDIDYFKKINDQHGHDVGDAVLVHVAQCLENTTRLSDIVCRIGGEEFFIVLDFTPVEGAEIFAENMRQRIEKSPVKVNGQTISVTISAGISVATGDSIQESLIKEADVALYQAKSRGRNQVVIFTNH